MGVRAHASVLKARAWTAYRQCTGMWRLAISAAQAEVGIAMGGGVDAAAEVANIVLRGDRVPQASRFVVFHLLKSSYMRIW